MAMTAAVPTASLVSKKPHVLDFSGGYDGAEDGEQGDSPAGDGAETFAGLPVAGENGRDRVDGRKGCWRQQSVGGFQLCCQVQERCDQITHGGCRSTRWLRGVN